MKNEKGRKVFTFFLVGILVSLVLYFALLTENFTSHPEMADGKCPPGFLNYARKRDALPSGIQPLALDPQRCAPFYKYLIDLVNGRALWR